jgi:hypothetical protein
MSIAPIKDPGWSDDDPILTPAEMNDFQAKLIGVGGDIDSADSRLQRIEKRALAQALFLRAISPANDGANETMGAVCLENGGFSEGIGALLVTGDKVLIAADGSRATLAETTLPGTHGAVYDAANQYDASRIIAVHASGNNNHFTDDFGYTWTQGGAIGFEPRRIIWNESLGLFIAVAGTGGGVARSTNGVSWATSTHSLATHSTGGVACFANGRTVICGMDGGSVPRLSISDNGSSWSDSAGFPDHGGPGWLGVGHICGTNGTKIWHAGFRSSPGAYLRISESTDAVTWTTIADFSTADDNMPPAAVQPTGDAKIMRCPNTGLMVVAGLKTGVGAFAIASIDDGINWGDPAFFTTIGSVGQLAVANGKLFHTLGDTISMSDGIGWR